MFYKVARATIFALVSANLTLPASAFCVQPRGSYAGAGGGPIFFNGQALGGRAEVFSITFPGNGGPGAFTWEAKNHPDPLNATTKVASIVATSGAIIASDVTWGQSHCKGNLTLRATSASRVVVTNPPTANPTPDTTLPPASTYVYTSAASGNTLTLTLINNGPFIAAEYIRLERQ
jgi:hypothetical protein